MDKQLFFAVWDLPELKHLIKSKMYPGKRTSNYYDYRNGDMALHHGYVRLVHEKSAELVFTAKAMDGAAFDGRLNDIIWLHKNRTEGCTTDAMNRAAKNGHLDIVIWLHKNRTEGCTTNAMKWAAENGHLDIVKWLHDNRTEQLSKKTTN